MAEKTMMIRNRAAFVASTDLIDASINRSIKELKLALQVRQTAAAIVLENVCADTLSNLSVRLNGSPIIDIRGVDLWALNVLAWGNTPAVTRAAAVIGNRTRILGLLAKLNQPARARGELQYKFGFFDGANCDTQELTAAEVGHDEAPEGGWLHYVEIPHTTPAALGYGEKKSLAMPGALKGLLLFSTTVPAAAADVVTAQDIKLFAEGTELIERSWFELAHVGTQGKDLTAAAAALAGHFLDNYAYLDLSRSPIPAGTKVEWQLNAGVVAQAVRLFPIYEVAGALAPA